MDELVSIGEAAAALGVCPATLRRWEAEGRLSPANRTAGGHRRYALSALARASGQEDGAVALAELRMNVAYRRWQRSPLKDEEAGFLRWEAARKEYVAAAQGANDD